MRRLISQIRSLRTRLQPLLEETYFMSMGIPSSADPFVAVNTGIEALRRANLSGPAVRRAAATTCETVASVCKPVHDLNRRAGYVARPTNSSIWGPPAPPRQLPVIAPWDDMSKAELMQLSKALSGPST